METRAVPLYRAIAEAIGCCDRATKASNAQRWRHHALALTRDHMPSGSGIDSGTTLDLEISTENKLVFDAPFHHMNDAGMYDGWTDHAVTVTPCLAAPGFRIYISGRDRNNIKEYLGELYDHALSQPVETYPAAATAKTADLAEETK